jgi:MFS family permease
MDDGTSASGSLFRLRAFRLLFTTRVCSNGANQMQAVAVGWQVYALTGSPLQLGLIGLVQFLPPLLLTLVVGQVVDRYDRRVILRCAYVVEFSVAASLLLLTALPNPPVAGIFAVLFVNAVARTFEGPSLGSLLPSMVPRAVLGRAVAAHAGANKTALLVGPSVGGMLYVFGPHVDYSVCMGLVLIAATASFLLPSVPPRAERPEVSWETLLAGLTFIKRTQLLLGALTLDLAATLSGSITALLPIFARDILEIGPWGFGLLRSSPALGALTVALVLSRYPIRRAAGRTMFIGLTVYGIATLLFGMSHEAHLSILLLLVVGSGEMMHTVLRHTLVQMNTPDEMRGRVLAVQSLSVSTSGQIGMFQSGLTASWLGAVGSVLLGGSMVLVIVALWAWRFPALRRADRPEELQAPRTALAEAPSGLLPEA